jgi:hypothetical protein
LGEGHSRVGNAHEIYISGHDHVGHGHSRRS